MPPVPPAPPPEPAAPPPAADRVHGRLAAEAEADRHRRFRDWRERCPRVRAAERAVLSRWRLRAG